MSARTSLALAWLACGGCDAVLGLKQFDHQRCWSQTELGNEDGDALADGCDPCPIDPEDVPVDTDQDGVPDVCDPDPAVGGDAIVMFDGFTRDVGWTTLSGTWTFDGDVVHQA